MKPKTKKILIIMAAIAIVAAIVYFAFIRKSKNSTAAIISRLNCDKDLKDGLTSMVQIINTSWDDASKQAIATKASANGRTLAQQTVIEALYALYDANQIDASTYQNVLAQILAA